MLTLLVGTFTAYALARLDFRFKNAVLGLIIATSMFPGISLIVPLLKLFTDINWINTYQAMIVPSLSFALPLAVWNLTAFFRQLPFELEQAAMVDGCTRGQAFRKIVIPLAAPGVFTTAILTFIAAWNEFLIAPVHGQREGDADRHGRRSPSSPASYGFDQPFGDADGGGRDRHRPADHRRAGLPAPHHRRPHRRRGEVTAGRRSSPHADSPRPEGCS